MPSVRTRKAAAISVMKWEGGVEEVEEGREVQRGTGKVWHKKLMACQSHKANSERGEKNGIADITHTQCRPSAAIVSPNGNFQLTFRRLLLPALRAVFVLHSKKGRGRLTN